MPETFETYIASERERLGKERTALLAQQTELAGKLTAITREFEAIEAYEAAKKGKPAAARQGAGRGSRARSGSKRDQLLQLIKDGHGLTRGEILEKMGLKGNKSGEMSVSNALTALTKGDQVARRDGKYVAA